MTRLAFALAVGLAPARADEPAKDDPQAALETPGLLQTQVSLAIERGRTRRNFRATVVRLEDDTMVVLTAAHCISDADEDGPALLLLGPEVVEGTVVDVARNPAYRGESPTDTAAAKGNAEKKPPRAKLGSTRNEIPGPDNAVARLRFRPANKAAEEAFRAIQAAPHVASRIYPGPGGQTVPVRMIDGHNVEHSLKAGNHSNPRWLQWGSAYRPIPGDSGGGVFFVQAGPDGSPRPVLIGIIVGRDDLGGGASLVARDQKWLADALSKAD